MGLPLRQASAYRLDGPLLVGELAGLELRIKQFSVHAQLESPTACRDQLQVANLLFVGGEQLARQTDGLWLVVSHGTVLQLHVHGFVLSSTLSHYAPGHTLGI